MWVIKFNGQTVESDSFLIEDLEALEKTTNTPWSIANPLKSITVAKAFLGIAMLRSGIPQKEIEGQLKLITLGSLKHTFDYIPDEQVPGGEGEDPLPFRPKTSRKSSRGRPIKGGSLPLPDESESATS